MSTDKHDMHMARTVSLTVREVAELAHEANALQADIVAEADAHRYTRDSLQSSNDARAVLVNELRKADEELADERRTCTAMEQTALTLRAQLVVERAKHARATAHIAAMATGQGWLPGKPFAQVEGVPMGVTHYEAARRELLENWRYERQEAINARDELRAFREQHDPIVQALQAELDAARDELRVMYAPHVAATDPSTSSLAVGTRVELTGHETAWSVRGRQGVIGELASYGLAWVLWDDRAESKSSERVLLPARGECVRGDALTVVEQPAADPEPRPFKVGDRVRHVVMGLGVVIEDDGADLDSAPWWVVLDASQHGTDLPDGRRCCDTESLAVAEWQPGERIEVGTEVEYVGQHPRTVTSRMIGTRATVAELVEQGGHDCATLHGHGGVYLIENLRRIS